MKKIYFLVWLLFVIMPTVVNANELQNDSAKVSIQKEIKKDLDTLAKQGKIPVNVTSQADCQPYNKDKTAPTWVFKALAIAFALFSFYMAFWKFMIKDIIMATTPQEQAKYPTGIIFDPTQKQYSFARTQGWWWTTIIVFCFVWGIGENNGDVVALNTTCLVLLGIGAGTTVLGAFIDHTDLQSSTQESSRHQDEQPHRNFLWDILNDGNNYSVHRFQAFIFNVIFGIAFTIEFFQNLNKFVDSKLMSCKLFPEYDNLTLSLLGISASVYLAAKTGENKSRGTQIDNNQESFNLIEKAKQNFILKNK